MKVFFGPMNQQEEISLDSLYPEFYTGVQSFEEEIIPVLPDIPSRYQENFHVHWFLALFPPFLDYGVSVSITVP
jgi:hypothetical protein